METTTSTFAYEYRKNKDATFCFYSLVTLVRIQPHMRFLIKIGFFKDRTKNVRKIE